MIKLSDKSKQRLSKTSAEKIHSTAKDVVKYSNFLNSKVGNLQSGLKRYGVTDDLSEMKTMLLKRKLRIARKELYGD